MDIKQYLHDKKEIVDGALERLLPSGDEIPAPMSEGIRYSVLSGGKRVRPVLLLAACSATGGEEKKALKAACAVELIHTYSLIHDDLPSMDDDDMRRGKPSLHVVMGVGNAILVGDALQALAFQIIADDEALGYETKVLLISKLAGAAGMAGMVGGQVADLASEGKKVVPESLEYIHRHKTAAMISASVLMGGIIGEADADALEDLKLYGENIGLAFQIVDDILDVVGNSGTLGKATGADEAREKATYPGLYGIEESRKKAGVCLENALTSLHDFDERADALREIAKYIVSRAS